MYLQKLKKSFSFLSCQEIKQIINCQRLDLVLETKLEKKLLLKY